MDPRIVPIWLANITEAKSPFFFAGRAPGYFVSGYAYAALATLASVVAVFLVERDRRRAATVMAAFAFAAVMVTTWQVRALPFALLFAMPGLAAFVVALVARLHLPARSAAAVCAFSLLAASDAGLPALAAGWAGRSPDAQEFSRAIAGLKRACLSPEAMTPLAALPPGRVLAFINEGPAILAYTKHSVVAGPYHRNAIGILDTYAVFTGTPDEARRIVERRGIDYVVVCPPELDYARYFQAGGPHSLLSRLSQARPIDWLTPLAGKGAVKIWRVVRS
jgi:hypothetical protein